MLKKIKKESVPHRNIVKRYPENSSPGDSTDDDGAVAEGNSGWADCMAKVLNTEKPKKKKVLVLSRAKRITEVKKEKKPYSFEIEGEIKEEETPIKVENPIKAEVKRKHKIQLRMKPNLEDRERERALRKIALRGTVQLFNAVRKQQKELQEQINEAGPLDHKKDAVLNNINKKKFLDVLMGGNRAKSSYVDGPVKKEGVKEESSSGDEEDQNSNQKKQWDVLRDDFMTNKKLKHWDQEDSDEGGPNSGDSDENGLSDDND